MLAVLGGCLHEPSCPCLAWMPAPLATAACASAIAGLHPRLAPDPLPPLPVPAPSVLVRIHVLPRVSGALGRAIAAPHAPPRTTGSLGLWTRPTPSLRGPAGALPGGMKKAKQLGYAPLPGALRSTSPLERAPSGVLGRRGVSPGGDASLRRPASKAPAKVVAPGQVRQGRRGWGESLGGHTDAPPAVSGELQSILRPTAMLPLRPRCAAHPHARACSLTTLTDSNPPPPPPPLPAPLPQPVQPGRSRERFISLPDEFQGEQQQPGQVPETTPTIFEVPRPLLLRGAGASVGG